MVRWDGSIRLVIRAVISQLLSRESYYTAWTHKITKRVDKYYNEIRKMSERQWHTKYTNKYCSTISMTNLMAPNGEPVL